MWHSITMITETRQAYHAHELDALAANLLTQAGLNPTIAPVVAKTLLEGDLLGHDTHGLALLPGYLKELQSGAMTKDGSYTVVSDKPAAVVWDGERLPGPWLIEQGLDMLMPRARELGTASLAIRRSHHIACLAVYLMRAARDGFLMVLASSDPNSASVAPHGGTRAVFTPNPIALGYPCTSGDVLIDISASITTNGMSNRKAGAAETFEHEWLIGLHDVTLMHVARAIE
jgi:LDH2 family malate/lactate/ureidoglycolate dehydrogenase